MDQWKQENHADYVQAKRDMHLGLGGVRKALNALRDYYAKDAVMLWRLAMPEELEKAGGAASSIIGISRSVIQILAVFRGDVPLREDDARREDHRGYEVAGLEVRDTGAQVPRREHHGALVRPAVVLRNWSFANCNIMRT